MKWIQAAQPHHTIKLNAGSSPLPILRAGTTENHHWAFCGDFEHLVRLPGTTWVETGPNSGKLVDLGGRTVGWVATLDDTPEIRDKDEWRMRVAELEAAMDTPHFQDWLKDEVAITS